MIGAEKPVFESVHAAGERSQIGQVRRVEEHPGISAFGLPREAGGRVLKRDDPAPHGYQSQELWRELMHLPLLKLLICELRQSVRALWSTYRFRPTWLQAGKRVSSTGRSGQSKSNDT